MKSLSSGDAPTETLISFFLMLQCYPVEFEVFKIDLFFLNNNAMNS